MKRSWLPAALILMFVMGSSDPSGSTDIQIMGAHRTADGLPHINQSRLESSLLTLGEIGRNPVTGGINRRAFSASDLEARRWFASQLEMAGMSVEIDPVANIIGTLPGTGSGRSSLVLGSHLDSVPEGGRFDGALGLMVALELVHTMTDLGISLEHTLEIVSFSDEEGGLVGSRGWIGTFDDSDLARIYGGRSLGELLAEMGLEPDQTRNAQRSEGEIAAYLEMHIEQGRILEREGLQVGIVEGIVALDEYEITVTGIANHAGTTRMPDRHDPVAAAARMITCVREEVLNLGGDLVGTVGVVEVEPGAPNVIPSTARFTIDIRDPSRLVLQRALDNLRARFNGIAREEKVEVEWSTLAQIPPAPADRGVMQALLEAATRYGYRHRVMPSGAGHDAQSIAAIAPMGMIFAMSVGGLSHTPAEFTRIEDAASGADVLLQTLLLLDRRLP